MRRITSAYLCYYKNHYNNMVNKLSLRLANKEDRDDFSSLANFELLNALANFDASRGMKLSSFVWQKLLGRISYMYRTASDNNKMINANLETIKSQDYDIDARLCAEEIRQILSPTEFKIANMVFVDELSYREIEQMTGYGRQTICNMIKRISKRLKIAFDEN